MYEESILTANPSLRLGHRGQIGRVGGQAQQLWGVGPVLTLCRLAVWPVRTLLNLWVRVFFLGGAPIDYSAANMVAVLRKTG